MNSASENAAAIYISNSNSIQIIKLTSNTYSYNFINSPQQNKKQVLGSVIYLIDPGSIFIENSIFQHNIGILGTCIYYSETGKKVIQLVSNTFKYNIAKYGAAAIYLYNNFQNINLKKTNNSFIGNLAYYANDFSTEPYNLRFINPIKYKISKSNSQYTLKITPGITSLNLTFEILDYYGQTIKFLNGSYSLLELRNNDFSNSIDSSINIQGVTSSTILNGLDIFFLFDNFFK